MTDKGACPCAGSVNPTAVPSFSPRSPPTAPSLQGPGGARPVAPAADSATGDAGWLRRAAAALALVFAAWSGLCIAKEGDRAEAALPSQRPGFRCVDALLRRIVDDVHPRTPQRLHLGPVEASESGAFLRVYWPQQRAILLIDWPATCTDADLRIDDLQLGWYRTKARIDLDTDVVPTPDDIHGSTYLVDKPWVDRVIAQCLAGETRVIRPSRRR